jgi:hypothetical protein
MQIFLKFMGWAILYSLLYFLLLDILGYPPGMTGAPQFVKTFNYFILPVISIPLWWFSWRWFEKLFSSRDSVNTPSGTVYRFALRNPALMYYLMVLKLFLLVMGANGVITLDQHGKGAQIFYVINFIVLYIYALPFFIIKFIKLKKALQASVTVDEARITLAVKETPVVSIVYADVQSVLVEADPPALCIIGPAGAVCLGGNRSRISPFYVSGLEKIIATLREKAGSKVEEVTGMKAVLKERGIKPLL